MSAITFDSKGQRLDSERKPHPRNLKPTSPFTSDRWRRKGRGPANLRGIAEAGPGITIYGDVRPCQVYPDRNWWGEQKLCEAILADALTCLWGVWGVRQQQQDIAWVKSRSRRYTYDFENICEVLGLDAEWIRAGILAKKEAA